MSGDDSRYRKIVDDDYEEDDIEPKTGLDGMIDYGVQHQDACFSVTAIAKILQDEFEDIASQSDYSIDSLIMRAHGESRGTDAFGGTSRAVLVGEALAYLHGLPSEVVLILCPVSLKSEFGDEVQLNPITGRDLLSNRVVDMLHRHDLVDDAHHSILTDDIQILSTTSFEKGDLIRNMEKVSVSRVMTATQRMQSRRGIVKPALPPGVRARVQRVDHSDDSLQWRCTENSRRSGWVDANSVEKVFRVGGIDNDDDDFDDTGYWKFFGGC